MPETAYLALYLDAPLQSWGYASKFDRRTTLTHPTRSGILGMLCAAAGIDRADEGGLARVSRAAITVYVFEQRGRLIDYHTVGGGYDTGATPLNVPHTAEGKPRGTVITHREYLESSRFGAIVSGEAPLIAELGAAMRNPVWGVWLGRKSCIPSSPVFRGLYPSEAEAAAALRTAAGTPGGGAVRVVREVSAFADGTDTLMDVPLSFARRAFAPRRILVETEEDT